MQNRKKIILCMRWLVIIVTSYLILFSGEKSTGFNLGHGFILLYLLSNLVLTFLPQAWFQRQPFFYALALFDVGTLSAGMSLSDSVTTDLYLVFFLILIITSLNRDYKFLVILSGIISILYGILLYEWGFLGPGHVEFWLRIPFLFIIASFYGYLVHVFNREKEDQVILSERKYRSLFEKALDGILLATDSTFRVLDANRQAEVSTGFRKKELQEKTLIDLFRPEDRSRGFSFLEGVIKTGENRADSLSLLNERGFSFDVDLSAKRVDLGETALVQMIFRDLSDQRRLEKKIQESKRSLQTIFDGIRDQLSLLALDFRILRVNRSVVNHFHATFQELLGKRCYEAYFSREVPCEECPVKETLKTMQPSSITRRIPGDGAVLRISSYPILDGEGGLTSVLVCNEDISDQQRLQEELVRSGKLAALGLLTSGLAHEVNNPLSGIMGMAEMALEEEDPRVVKDCLNDILRCGQKISDIVAEFSSYSRTAKQENTTPVDILELIENALKMAQRINKTIPVEVVRDFQPVQKWEANSGEIQLVFYNLIQNAFQAVKQKGGKLILVTRPVKDGVAVKVTDDGVGIPQQYLDQVFDPFFTTRQVGEGKGLGLNTVYRIVTKYHGTIQVESKEEVGTTFTVLFPTRRNHEAKESLDRR